jgi:sugar fermentation stimulation protein
MTYENIHKGIFIARPNRFIAEVIVDDRPQRAHVKNTGRCRELLLEDATVYLQKHDNTNRRTNWSLVGVEKDGRLVNIDSQAPNKVFHEWLREGNLFGDIKCIKPEFTYGNSRFDFFVETINEKLLIEVKGVTLEENDVAMFPDAPTERGIKHLLELGHSIKDGFKAYIVFIIQMSGVKYFTPNSRTHQAFADALKDARDNGVQILAFDCQVYDNGFKIKGKVDVVL